MNRSVPNSLLLPSSRFHNGIWHTQRRQQHPTTPGERRKGHQGQQPTSQKGFEVTRRRKEGRREGISQRAAEEERTVLNLLSDLKSIHLERKTLLKRGKTRLAGLFLLLSSRPFLLSRSLFFFSHALCCLPLPLARRKDKLLELDSPAD